MKNLLILSPIPDSLAILAFNIVLVPFCVAAPSCVNMKIQIE